MTARLRLLCLDFPNARMTVSMLWVPLLYIIVLSLKAIIFERDLKSDRQICSVVKSAFYWFRILSKVNAHLSPIALERVIHAFILSKPVLHHLQLVQSATVHLQLALRSVTTLHQFWPPCTGFVVCFEDTK